MASLSKEYLTSNDSSLDRHKKNQSAMYKALVYSTRGSDLTALLIATKAGLEKIPVLCLSEAES